MLPSIPSELVPISQEDSKVVEHNYVVKDDPLDPEPSRGCPIRHLALQKSSKFSPVMIITEHESEDHREEKAYFDQSSSAPVLESFIIFSIGKKVFYSIACLLCLLTHLVAHMHGSSNQLMRKSIYFKKIVNGFV